MFCDPISDSPEKMMELHVGSKESGTIWSKL